uniref:ATP synthase subunit 6 n=1 Tax=Versteria mustelae TaxID=1434714 RepID=A0A4D6E5Q9_9CEST|nr:ATP synthase subunit 6 [Versteria mustelae]
MFFVINGFSSLICSFYKLVVNTVSYYYFFILSWVLSLFLSYRFPYCYSPYFFCVFLIVVVFVMFFSLFLCRLYIGADIFFSSFIPVGTPAYICFLVCMAETISYVIRPFVLILRPFINISLGCFGAISIGGLCFYSIWWVLIMVIIFFYEVFVALVHWYIVTSILSFSVDH